MAAIAAKNGTRRIICTPHCSSNDPNLPQRLRMILDRTEEMNHMLADAEIPVELQPGMELLCAGPLAPILTSGEFLTLGFSRYLLMEFRFNIPFAAIHAAAQEVTDAGLRPVLAHPERYDCVQREPERLRYWLDSGWLIQVNRGSLTGSLGSGAERTAMWLLYRRMAHLCASDAHSATYRTPDLRAGYELIAHNFGESYAELLLETNPYRLLKDRYIPNPVV